MKGESRKKSNMSVGGQSALPNFNVDNTDKYIIKDLGINKEKEKKEKTPYAVKKIAIISFAVLLIITIIFTIRFVNFNVAEMLWKTSVTKGSDSVNNKSIRYCSFRNGLLRISNDGVTYIDEVGNVKWTISYNMKEPLYVSNDDYAVIANKNGYEFYVFDFEGLIGENTTTMPIVKISMAKNGIIYILQNNSENSYINVYDKYAKEIDISIKTNIDGDGMPLDIGVSSDGTELVVSYACLSDSEVYTKATYYNFDDVGQNLNSKRVVGEFIEDFDDKFIGRVHFFDSIYSCIIFDGGVYFVSTRDKGKPEIFVKHDFEDAIDSISYNDDYLVLIFDTKKMLVLSRNGSIIADKELDFDYESFYISDNYIIFIYGKRIMIYDARGRMIFDKELDMQTQYVAKKRNFIFTELLIGLIDGVECIRFY